MATRVQSHKLATEEKHLTTARIKVAPLTPVLGAEIEGVDLSEPLDDETFEEVRAAFNAYGVLVFRNQVLSNEDHKRFARMFGRLHVHPYHVKSVAPEHTQKSAFPDQVSDPEILVVKADQDSKFVAGEDWHTDVTCDEEPPMGSMLYLTKTPDIGGGDTCFASTTRAYDALSVPMQGFLETLSAVHDGAKPYTGGYGTPAPPGGWPKTVHPLIARHPDTGKKMIFVNRGFTTRIVGLARKESDALLEFLWRHIESNPAFQCRVRWTPNTLVFWDNRVTQHHAVWDYYPHSRYGQRVSIIGTRPTL